VKHCAAAHVREKQTLELAQDADLRVRAPHAFGDELRAKGRRAYRAASDASGHANVAAASSLLAAASQAILAKRRGPVTNELAEAPLSLEQLWDLSRRSLPGSNAG
jgi:hypothetical protein